MPKVYIDFSFESKISIDEKLSEILKVSPSEKSHIGDKLRNGLLLEYNFWGFSTKKIEALMLEDACDYFLNIFASSKNQLIKYLNETTCRVSICFVLSEIEEQMPSLSFTKEFIKYVAEVGADLSIDL